MRERDPGAPPPAIVLAGGAATAGWSAGVHADAREAELVLDAVLALDDEVVVMAPVAGERGIEHLAEPVDDHRLLHLRQNAAVDFGVVVRRTRGLHQRAARHQNDTPAELLDRGALLFIGADHIMIADTGSTDGTAEKARIHGATVHSICISPWRFDHARNAALSLIPADIDICISLDLDEVMEPGWREEIERVWKLGETTQLRYYFDWGCGIKFMYEKIHARHGYHWHHPCHEYPRADARVQVVWAQTDKLLVSHHPDPTKSRGQYLDLLELSVKEDPFCPRNAFYYARELSFHGKWQQAIEACKSYLNMPNATWMNERCYALRVMGRCYQEVGDWKAAENAFHMASVEAPNTREPWCELALLLYRQSRWAECFAFSMRALGITDRELVYTCDPTVWEHWPHDLAAISAWHLGLKDIAIEQGKLALEKTPNDARLQANLDWFLGKEKEAA